MTGYAHVLVDICLCWFSKYTLVVSSLLYKSVENFQDVSFPSSQLPNLNLIYILRQFPSHPQRVLFWDQCAHEVAVDVLVFKGDSQQSVKNGRKKISKVFDFGSVSCRNYPFYEKLPPHSQKCAIWLVFRLATAYVQVCCRRLVVSACSTFLFFHFLFPPAASPPLPD